MKISELEKVKDALLMAPDFVESPERMQVLFGYFADKTEQELREEMQKYSQSLHLQRNRLVVLARKKISERRASVLAFESEH